MDPNAHKSRWRLRSIKPSIGVSLGIAFAVVFLALALGMRLAHRSTEQAALLIGSVERQYEPVLRKARELEEALDDYERVVADHTHANSGDPAADIGRAGARLASTFDDYWRLAAAAPGAAGAEIRPRLGVIRV